MDRRSFLKTIVGGAAIVGLSATDVLGVSSALAESNVAAQNITAEKMAANPAALSGKRITCKIDSGLLLENAVIKNATFVNSKIWRSAIKNVTFENCNFSQTHFVLTSFENVTFKGGSITNRSSDDACFEDVGFKNVVIDGVDLNGAYFQIGCQGSRLVLKNLTNIRNKNISFFINDTKLVIDNCKAKGEFFAIIDGEESTVFVNNSEFRDISGIGGFFKAMYIQNSKFLGFSFIGGGLTTVIKNSVLTGEIGNGVIDEMYLINNQYQPVDPKDLNVGRTVLESSVNGKVFLDGHDVKNACLNIISGHVFIANLECINLNVLEFADDLIPQTLDLLNVVIKGAYFGPLEFKSARWQNVTILPPLEVEDVKIHKLETHNVTFPQGSPFTENSPGNDIQISESAKPLNFPEIIVPTPQSLGIIME
jgi:uncharacterized protein YjbI with pentapeptide repeats